MTMPPFTERPEDARPHFARLRELRDRLRGDWGGRHDFTALSMGTTQDYEVAVEEGATIVRLGSVLYASGLRDEDALAQEDLAPAGVSTSPSGPPS